MQFDKARYLRERWGDKPCSHPSLEKEYHLGAQTGDYVCSTCGKEFTEQERNDRLKDNKTDEE